MTGTDPELGTSTVADAASVIASRAQAARRKMAFRVGLVAGVVVLVVVLVWLVWFSPAFVTRSLDVTGNNQVSTAEITDAANVAFGTPLARLDTAAIAQRVEALPAVADATVSRQLSGVVQLKVTERQPVYAIAVDGQFLLVDADGVGYLTVAALPSALPMVALDLTEQSDATARLMRDAATIVGTLPTSVTAQMTELKATTPDDFQVTLTSGVQIVWGGAEQSDLKADVIEALMKTPGTYYDVSSPTHPATHS